MAEGLLRFAPAEGFCSAVKLAEVITSTSVSAEVLTAVPLTIPFMAEAVPAAGKNRSEAAVRVTSLPVSPGALLPRALILMKQIKKLLQF